MGGADRRGEAGFGAQRIAAGDEGEVVRASAQFVDEIGDQIVEPASLADQADERLARHGFFRGEDGGFDAQHPFAPARGRAAGRGARRRGFRRRPRCRRRAAALIGRTAGTSGRPESSRAAPSATRRSNSRRAARPVIGAWRAASAGETQSWASRRSTIFWAGFERSLGATAIRVFERRREIGGEVEGGGGGERDRARGGVWPGWVARPWSSSGARQSAGSDPGFSTAISGTGRGQRSRMAMTMSNAQSAKDFGWGRWGVRDGGERQGGGFCGRRNRIALPCASLQACCEAVRVHSQVEPRRCVEIRPGSRLGGRPAPSRQSDRRFAAGPSGSPTAKRRSRSAAASALRRRILARGRGALQREAGAQRPGGGRIGAQECVEQREPGAGGKQGTRPPLPFRSPAPRPGSAPAAERLAVPGFSPGSPWLARACRNGAERRS